MKSLDLIGQKFGKLLVLRKGVPRSNDTCFICICDCGNEKEIRGYLLRNGHTKSCGCLKKDYDFSWIIGKRFGMMVVLSGADRVGKKNVKRVLCRCDCGIEKNVLMNKLISEEIKSCGRKGCRTPDHRIIGGSKHPLYRVWDNMHQRCINPNNKSYSDYGGRGVSVCEEWNDYEKFHSWALQNGWKKGLHIDKDIKGDGLLYSPNTCSIVTQKENNRKTRWTKLNMQIAEEIRSSNLSVKELAKKYNIDSSTIYSVKNKKSWI